MDNYIAIIFDDDAKASSGLHELWALDNNGDITVHGAAVIHRDKNGYIEVATKRTDPGVRTAVGIGVGALLGALAGPIGVAAGVAGAANVAVGAAAGVGAATGGAIGLSADAVKASEHEEALYESGFVVKAGQAAVLAEVSEDWTTTVDNAMHKLGGKVYRRPKSDVRTDAFFGDDGYGYYLYPYDYEPYYIY
ncbi:MAG: hypothetical protein JO009_00740 [Candidatus Eremiobacteraeota bacterium]|nr:hypothetical protein [Candidatus Eremiobacteraeota bacterium]